MKRKKKAFNKIVSLLVLAAFVFSQSSAFAAPGISNPISNVPSEIGIQNLIENLQIPQELGTIQERFISPDAKSESPTIIHIQDAHANYEAQRNIHGIIDYLNKQYGISLVMLEGGAEELDPKLLQIFKDPKYNAEMVDLLVKKGELTGAEAFLTEKSYESNSKVDAYGIEDQEAYKKDLEHFRAIWPDTEAGRAFVGKAIQLIDRAGSRTINKDLRAFLREWQSYKESRSHLNSYLNILKERAKSILKLDLSHARNQIEWPVLLRIYKLKEMESKLNLQQAKGDWLRAKQFLKSVDVNPALIEELENKLYGKKSNQFDWAESTRDLFQYLLDVAGPKGFTFKDYPQLAIWVGNSILRSEIESDEIFAEIDRLNNLILDKLAPTPQEKQIIELFRQNYLLKDLFALELSRDNLARIKAGVELFKPSEVVRRIEAIDPTTEYGNNPPLESIEKLYQDCLKSYEFALAREAAFFTNLSSAIKKTGKNKAITVCGGFHTRGFADIFKANKMSYVIISPRITMFQDVEKEHDNYINSLMQPISGKTTNVSTRTNPPYIDPAYAENGGSVAYARAELRTAVDEIATRYSTGSDALFPGALNRLNESVGPKTFKAGGLVVTTGQFANGELPGAKSELRAVPVEDSSKVAARDALHRLGVVGSVVGRGILGIPSQSSVKSELRTALNLSATINGIELRLYEQQPTGVILSIQGAQEAVVHPAFTFGSDKGAAHNAYDYALALARGEISIPTTVPPDEVLAVRIRSAVESFVDKEQLGAELADKLEVRSELRDSKQLVEFLTSGSSRSVLDLTGELLPKSELRRLGNDGVTLTLSKLGIEPVSVALQALTLEVVSRFDALLGQMREILFGAEAVTTKAQVIRTFSDIPANLDSIQFDLFTVATQPDNFRISIVLPNGTQESDRLKFESEVQAQIKNIRTAIGASEDLTYTSLVQVAIAGEDGKATARAVSRLIQPGIKLQNVVIISDDRGLLDGVSATSFRIHNNLPATAARSELRALSAMAVKLAFGLDKEDVIGRFRLNVLSALDLVTQGLQIVQEAARRIAVAA